MNEEQRKKLTAEVQYREIRIPKEAVSAETRTVQIAFSSEEPVERWYGVEVLDHKSESVRMTRLLDGAPFLLQHDPGEQIGVVEKAQIDSDKVGRASVRFSKSPEAEIIFQDIIDGIRSKISVGYMVHEMVLDKKDDKTETYRVTDWEPMEISLVSIPADNTVGVGRNLNNNSQISIKESKTMEGEEKKLQDTVTAPPQFDQQKERERMSEIFAIAQRYAGKIKDIEQLRDAAAKDPSITKEKFYWDVTSRMDKSKDVDTPDGLLGLSEKEKKVYSLSRAIVASVRKDWSLAPFELECSRAVAEKTGTPAQGFYLPHDIKVDPRYLAKRDVTGYGTTTVGGYLVGTYHDGASFIDLLRNEMVFQRLGANVMTGLKQAIDIPKMTTGTTFYWISTEGNAITSESSPVFAQLLLHSHVGGAYVDYTFKALTESIPSVDSILQYDIAQTCALAVDAAGFHGSNASGQPCGIASTSGIGSVDGAAIGWDACIEFITDVWTANAKADTCAFVTNPTVWGYLKTRSRGLDSDTPLIADDGTMAGYPVIVTNQISSGYLFFGDFRQAIVGFWGNGIDILVDPYTASSTGTVRIRALVSTDIGVRVPAAFSVASNVS